MIKACILVLSISLLVSAQSGMSACTAGRMTYYNYGSDGGCSFGALTGSTGVYVVAPNEAYFNNAAQCGICYEVTGKKGTVTVMVADYCPVSGNEQWCSGDITHFDMNQPAFDAAGILSDGVESMTFRQVSCPVSGNIGLHLKDGSSIYWFGILVNNHRVGVTSVEVQPSGTTQWTTLQRQSYNYFLWTTGTMTLPMQVRITGVTGEKLTTTVSSIGSDVLLSTSVQFSTPGAGYTGSASVGCGSNATATGSNTATTGSKTASTTGSVSTTATGSNTATTGSNSGSTTGSGIDIGIDIFLSGLISGWQDWSWDCVNTWTDAGVDPGTVCLTSQLSAWGGVQLSSYPTPTDVSTYSGISFYAKTSDGVYNQLYMKLNDGDSYIMVTGITTTWQKFYVPFDDLGGNPGTISLIMFQNFQTTSATLYFDKVTLVSQYGGGGVPWNPNAAIMYSTTGSSDAVKSAVSSFVAIIVMIALLF